MHTKREKGGKKRKDHQTKHMKRSERAKLEMKTERAFKRQPRHPEAEVRSGLIRYDKRHGSLLCRATENNTASRGKPGHAHTVQQR